MSQSANVRSVEAIHDFKVALATFAEDARNALGASEMELRRVRDWLGRDQLAYWQGQVKRCQEQVAMARADLFRRKISQQASGTVSDADQKEALRVALRRLQEAEDKVVRVKKWIPVVEHAIAEYHSSSQPLGDRLAGSLVNALTLLERMITSVENYLSVAPPSAPSLPPQSAESAEARSVATGSTPAATPRDESAVEPASRAESAPAIGEATP